MKLTATSNDVIVEYEWTINDVIYSGKTQTIEVDVKKPDVITVRGLNDCGNWSQSITLKWDEDIDIDEDELILYAGIIIVIILLVMKK